MENQGTPKRQRTDHEMRRAPRVNRRTYRIYNRYVLNRKNILNSTPEKVSKEVGQNRDWGRRLVF